MKTLSLWIRPEALTNGQIKEKACNEYMNIMEVTGKDVLYPDMPKGFHALLLFLTEGEISFVMKNNLNTLCGMDINSFYHPNKQQSVKMLNVSVFNKVIYPFCFSSHSPSSQETGARFRQSPMADTSFS